MTLADDLRAAKALIDTPEKWASHDNQRALVNAESKRLCSYDACRVLRPLYAQSESMLNALREAFPTTFNCEHPTMHPVAVFNDDPDTTHADIMAMFDRAIAKAESSQ